MSDPRQDLLAAEHAAVWLFATLGGRVSRSAAPDLADALTRAHQMHRARRDQLTAELSAEDAEPVPAEAGYVLPNEARTTVQLAAAALEVESRCTAIYSAAVARTSGAGRARAVRALVDSAVRQLTFGGVPAPLPGA